MIFRQFWVSCLSLRPQSFREKASSLRKEVELLTTWKEWKVCNRCTLSLTSALDRKNKSPFKNFQRSMKKSLLICFYQSLTCLEKNCHALKTFGDTKETMKSRWLLKKERNQKNKSCKIKEPLVLECRWMEVDLNCRKRLWHLPKCQECSISLHTCKLPTNRD